MLTLREKLEQPGRFLIGTELVSMREGRGVPQRQKFFERAFTD